MSRKPTKKDQEFFEAQRRYQCWLHEPPVPVPREVLERVRGALAALLREEPLVYEGNLEAKLYVTVDALTDSRIALADLDRLLNE